MATKQIKQLPLAPEVIPAIPEGGPEIQLIGLGAEKVQFTINPLAKKYVVRANGQVTEYL
jgi:hypothetical protein